MKSYTAIIIDDETTAAALLQLSLQALFPDIDVQHICYNWKEALHALQQQRFDFVFLDIDMPGKSGIDLVRLLPQQQGRIIFVTAYEEYTMDAFKCHASGYLLKPLEDTALYALVSKLLQDIPAIPAQDKRMLGIPGSKGIDYIHTGDILYLQAEHKCTRVALKHRILYSSYNLGRFRDFLPAVPFFQVHRSYIINLQAVQRYLPEQAILVMNDNAEIPVARSAKELLLQQFPTLGRKPDLR